MKTTWKLKAWEASTFVERNSSNKYKGGKKKNHLGPGKQMALFQEWSGVEFGKMRTQTERATSKVENPQAANPAALDSSALVKLAKSCKINRPDLHSSGPMTHVFPQQQIVHHIRTNVVKQLNRNPENIYINVSCTSVSQMMELWSLTCGFPCTSRKEQGNTSAQAYTHMCVLQNIEQFSKDCWKPIPV